MIDLSQIYSRAKEESLDVRVVFKEYLHFVILNFLFEKGAFDEIVFQGGTALKFAYGGVRYSQDLDFVFKRKNRRYFDRLPLILEHLSQYIERWFLNLENSQLKLQKKSSDFQRYFLITESGPFLGKNKAQIEFALVPSYEWQIVILRKEAIPFEPAVLVETPQEILSDKIVALGSRNYLKGKDLWDIYFLITTLKVNFERRIEELINRKIYDYNLNKKDFKEKLKNLAPLLEERGEEVLKKEMERFLPVNYRKVFERESKKILKICNEILDKAITSL
jgi:predicted nucleotidyltransferase component of viral defense system